MRPVRGARLASFQPPLPDPLPSVFEIESAFQLQEYIALLIRHDVHDVERIVSVPSPPTGAAGANSVPEEDRLVDEGCWVYEHLRRLAQDLTQPLITTLQQECTRQSCPEMKAGEWLYLCVAHGGGGTTECCAIDYIIHTLDSATAVLNSPRAFPSRIQIPQASHRHFASLARRLSRIFAHAYFHHREAFEQSEAETSLYARFLALSQKFDLVPPEFLVIPAREAALSQAMQPANLTTDISGTQASGNSPNSESPNETMSPNSLARIGRPRTDTMFFSGDFNFMQVVGGSPLQGAATDPPKVDLDGPGEKVSEHAAASSNPPTVDITAPPYPPVEVPAAPVSDPFADPDEAVAALEPDLVPVELSVLAPVPQEEEPTDDKEFVDPLVAVRDFAEVPATEVEAASAPEVEEPKAEELDHAKVEETEAEAEAEKPELEPEAPEAKEGLPGVEAGEPATEAAAEPEKVEEPVVAADPPAPTREEVGADKAEDVQVAAIGEEAAKEESKEEEAEAAAPVADVVPEPAAMKVKDATEPEHKEAKTEVDAATTA